MSELAVQSINQAVQGMYEAFPYPNYSLFVPLRWQEAYASGSLFALRLAQAKGEGLIAQQDVVVKTLDAVRGGAPWFTGATVLGDGTPSLIVDLGSLL